MELNYAIQTYDWGKKGTESLVAELRANTDKNFKIEKNVAYSELWIGTHVNGPSTLKTGETLADVITQHPEYLGERVQKQFGNQLPFLFKILSVNKALSIQAHPSKKHAEDLHKLHPNIYKDPNHKPELAIALTPFEALCGFRPLSEIVYFLKNIPELNYLVKDVLEKHKTESKDLLKEAFRSILICPKPVISTQLQNLVKRLKPLDKKKRIEQLADLIEMLYHQYPDDAGCFMVYFFNYVQLEPFEAIYLGPNEPHAYIYGDCVECMACSDNVVRAGLTPKHVDVNTLCSMLIYKGEKPEEKIFKPIPFDNYTKIFKPPVPDFAVAQINLPESLEKYEIKPRNSASTLFVVSGEGKSEHINLIPGTAIFLPANLNFTITNISIELLIYRAFVNV